MSPGVVLEFCYIERGLLDCQIILSFLNNTPASRLDYQPLLGKEQDRSQENGGNRA